MTAVEWLINEIEDMYIHQCYSKEFEQAKEMERKQIIEAISEANKSNNRNVSLNPNQYYKDKFLNIKSK